LRINSKIAELRNARPSALRRGSSETQAQGLGRVPPADGAGPEEEMGRNQKTLGGMSRLTLTSGWWRVRAR
jgi:hypothetical protein